LRGRIWRGARAASQDAAVIDPRLPAFRLLLLFVS
jgi:hypothetical protein